MDFHINEGEFPVNLYSNNYRISYANGYHLDSFCQCPECAGGAELHKTVAPVQNDLYVVDVAIDANTQLVIKIAYSNGSYQSYNIEKNKQYQITYISNGELITKVGVITGASKIANTSSSACECSNAISNTSDYILRLDASTVGNSNVVNIKASSIRSIKTYVPYADEDTTIANASTYGATVVGTVTDLSITDAIIDDNGNVTDGTITSATLDVEKSIVADSCATGLNSNNHKITLIYSTISGGTITKGTIVSAKLTDYTTTDKTTTAKTAIIVARECNITNAKSEGGIVINPEIENSVVVGGVRNGLDMKTSGTMVLGNEGIGGVSVGGTLTGGTATGMIEDNPYIIYNGTTTGGYTINTGKVTGGTVETANGKTITNSIAIGGVIDSGSIKDGITFNGTTKVADTEDSYIKPQYTVFPADVICKCNTIDENYPDEISKIIIWFKFTNPYIAKKSTK